MVGLSFYPVFDVGGFCHTAKRQYLVVEPLEILFITNKN